MRRLASALVPLVLALASAPISAQATTDDRVHKLLVSLDELWRGESSQSTLSMNIKTKNYTRNMKMHGWSKGLDRSLIRITAPIKEKGTTTLKSGKSLYTYLPRTDRTIRLTSAMMGGSWMGSHLTNDDLVRETKFQNDFKTKITFEGERDGQTVIELTMVPNPDAPVVWGQVVVEMRLQDNLPKKITYYDEDLAPTRTTTFEDYRDVGTKRAPMRMRVVPADKPDEYTELVYESLELGVDIKDSFFSIQRLRRR